MSEDDSRNKNPLTIALGKRRVCCAGSCAARMVRRRSNSALLRCPSLLLMFAIIETALIFFAQQTLETAVADLARLVLTGQAQKRQGRPERTGRQFLEEVCARCTGYLRLQRRRDRWTLVDVRSGQSFDGVNAPTLDTPEAVTALRKSPSYQPGGPGAIVAVRLIYEWPVLTWDWLNLSPMNNGKRLLIATAVFRNEPFPP